MMNILVFIVILFVIVTIFKWIYCIDDLKLYSRRNIYNANLYIETIHPLNLVSKNITDMYPNSDTIVAIIDTSERLYLQKYSRTNDKNFYLNTTIDADFSGHVSKVSITSDNGSIILKGKDIPRSYIHLFNIVYSQYHGQSSKSKVRSVALFVYYSLYEKKKR